MTDPVELVTFGCRLNAFESEVMRGEAAAAGLEHTVIVNTCAVTAEAVRQSRQAIRRARRGDPAARIIVTGCAAQTEPETFAAMAEVDHVIGNAEKLDRSTYCRLAVAGPQPKISVGDIMAEHSLPEALITGFSGRARAFVRVQDGCDHRCTFCIIPFGRGPSRSVPMGAVVEQIKRLVGQGFSEAVLTGVDITAYGADLAGRPRLGSLVKRILRHVPDLRRLRLSSIDSVEADDDLLDALASDPRLMPHLHLSLQSGDDMILKRMKRRHTVDDAARFCERARSARPDIVFGADLIAGFPTETEAMAENTLAFVEDCGLTFLHVFPFSARPGTPAARMPQLPRDEVKARAQALRRVGDAARRRFLRAEHGQDRAILVERPYLGRTEHFAEVELCQPAAPGMPITHGTPVTPGTIVTAHITSDTGSRLIADPVG